MSADAPAAAAPDPRGRHGLTCALFVRALGAVHLAAFLSYWSQVDGLVGSRGILPAARLVESMRTADGGADWLRFPTLCWLGTGDGFLHALCAAGAALSLLLVAGVSPRACLLLLWALYLSLVRAGGEFFFFQWDTLLLETTFAAVFVAPWSLRPRLGRSPEPSPIGLWLVRWVLFRLMFESGVVKLTWDDPSWSLGKLDALTWHYWTQPLPPATAWWFDRLPLWFHQASAAGMYAVELIAPFAMLGPRRARLAGAAAMAGLQVVLLVSGNYGFFNLLTLVLVLPALDDAVWPARLRRGAGVDPPPAGWRLWAPAPFAALVLLVNVPQMFATFRVESGVAEALRPVARAVAPFETVNAYGLFRVMTKERREIVIEGSDDGVAWKAYEFRWKPGDPMRRPEFTTPHMPRLDWQMWFAAFGPPEQSPWFGALEDRLLEGSPEVLALFAVNPFPDRPPRYVRSLIYDYRFADREMRAETGAWWSRGLLGMYDPPRSR